MSTPAFPSETMLGWESGMTLRDYFAAKGMEGSRSRNSKYETWDDLAKDSYEIADAMMKAREE